MSSICLYFIKRIHKQKKIKFKETYILTEKIIKYCKNSNNFDIYIFNKHI